MNTDTGIPDYLPVCDAVCTPGDYRNDSNHGVYDINIDTEITDGLPGYRSVSMTRGLQENDSNPWVYDMNIGTGITDSLPGYRSVSMTRGLQENDSNPWVCDMNIDTGIPDYLPVWWGACDTVDYRKMTTIRGYMA